MGNTNTHVSERERRKSSRGAHDYGGAPFHHYSSGGGGSNSSSGGGGGGGLSHQHDAINAAAAQHHRRNSVSSSSSRHPHDEVGPVEVTAAGVHGGGQHHHHHQQQHGHQRERVQQRHSVSGSRAHEPHRPRATTDAGHGHGGRRTRQISLDQSALNADNFLGGGSPSAGSGSGAGDGGGGDNTASKKGLPTIFKYPAGAGGKEVYVCGTFNNWERIRMNPSTKDFSTLVNLEEGDYEYKFLVDGQWVNDPASTDLVTTNEGHKNNLLRIRKEDFNALDALDMDSQAVLNAKSNAASRGAGGSGYYRPQTEFGQELPPAANAGSVPGSGGGGGYRSGPPILPPHLLQVILNKDTPLSCEPTLLPEPNHVMLNHLYALSIKDGVMVLSSTHRYRKKYVTTLLYKPMGSRKAD